MRKRLYVLIIVTCFLVVLGSVLYSLYVADSANFVKSVTVSQLSGRLEDWLGVRVRVQGEIVNLMFIPEELPPYRFGLRDPTTKDFVGVFWLEGSIDDLPYDKIVTVVGVIVEGRTEGLLGGRTVYYLRAESIWVN